MEIKLTCTLLAINDDCIELILKLKRFFKNDRKLYKIINTKDYQDIEEIFRRS